MKTDEELMVLYQTGEYGAFDELYSRHVGRVYGYLKTRLYAPGEAEDLMQQVFLKIHKSRHRYDPSFPFLPWVFTIARHTLLDHLRKSVPVPFEIEKLQSIVDKSQKDTESYSEDQAPNWDEVLKPLPENQRNLIKLRFEEELSFEEIAKRSGINEVSARKRLSRALQSIRKTVVGDKKGLKL